MKQKKISKVNRSKKLARRIIRKHINRSKLCHLEIQIPEMKENIITCIIPVTEVRSRVTVNRKINTKKNHTYRIIARSYKSEWKIAKINTPYITIDGLINSKIQVTDGKRVVVGIVVKAKIVGGGATSPPAEGGLPPVDE